MLLLAGVTLNAFFSALILFVQYLADFADTFRGLRWLMGNLDVPSYGPLLAALPMAGWRELAALLRNVFASDTAARAAAHARAAQSAAWRSV